MGDEGNSTGIILTCSFLRPLREVTLLDGTTFKERVLGVAPAQARARGDNSSEPEQADAFAGGEAAAHAHLLDGNRMAKKAKSPEDASAAVEQARQSAAGARADAAAEIQRIRDSAADPDTTDSTAEWLEGVPPFRQKLDLIDHVVPWRRNANPFFEDPHGSKAPSGGLANRERYFQGRTKALLYPRSDASTTGVEALRWHSRKCLPLSPLLPGGGFDAPARQAQGPSHITVVAREYIRIDIPDVLSDAEYVGIHAIVTIPRGNDPFSTVGNTYSAIMSPSKMRRLGIAIVQTPANEATVRASTHLVLPGGTGLMTVLDDHAALDKKGDTLRALLNDQWTSEDIALYLLAHHKTLSEKAPDPAEAPDHEATIYFSSDWRAMVSRYGFAFLGLNPIGSPGGFHQAGRSLAMSFYFDTLLLGQVQLDAANALADAAVAIDLSRPDDTAIESVEAALLTFRSKVWWTHVTERAEISVALLRAFHRQHRLPELVDSFNQDLTDIARYQSLRSQARGARAIGLLSALFVAPTIMLAFITIYLTHFEWREVANAVALCLAAGLIMYGVWKLVVERRIGGHASRRRRRKGQG